MITELVNYNLLRNNTFGLNVSAKRFIDYTDPSDLPAIFATIGNENFRCIGQGSNMLFLNNYDGVLLHSSIKDIESNFLADGYRFSLGSGVDFDTFVQKVCDAGIWGLENLSGIPGDAGSAAVQNIGAYGVEISDFIESVECYDIQANKFVNIDNLHCRYSYRNSIFKLPENRNRYVVVKLNLFIPATIGPKLEYGNLEAAISGKQITSGAVREAVIAIRDAKLPSPSKVGSAGSFFMNPVLSVNDYDNLLVRIHEKFGNDISVPHFPLQSGEIKVPAAWLIEKSGWKGRTLGNAACWHLQPLVLVNATGNATSADILNLENSIINDVKSIFGITLKPEVDHI